MRPLGLETGEWITDHYSGAVRTAASLTFPTSRAGKRRKWPEGARRGSQRGVAWRDG
jgi:hypothetical protein